MSRSLLCTHYASSQAIWLCDVIGLRSHPTTVPKFHAFLGLPLVSFLEIYRWNVTAGKGTAGRQAASKPLIPSSLERRNFEGLGRAAGNKLSAAFPPKSDSARKGYGKPAFPYMDTSAIYQLLAEVVSLAAARRQYSISGGILLSLVVFVCSVQINALSAFLAFENLSHSKLQLPIYFLRLWIHSQ